MFYSVNPLLYFERGLARLDKQVARRILEKIDDVAENPQKIRSPMGNLPKDLTGLHKLRVGDWRVFFWASNEKKELILYFVGNRSDAYKNLYRRK